MQTTLRNLTVAWPLVIFLLLPALTRAETAVQAWVQRYNGPGNGDDGAYAMAVDGSNNVVVMGYSNNGHDYDYATIKYSAAGVPLWTNRYNAQSYEFDLVAALAVDSSNNVIVVGSPVTIKYSSAGAPLWTNGGGWAVAVDGGDNVIVMTIDYVTIKYSSAGVPLWTNLYKGPGQGYDLAYAVAVDGSNNVIVTGASYGSGSSDDYATIKYSAAGVPLWTNRYNGPGNRADGAYAVAVDGSNNVIVTGYSAGINSDDDGATIKYSSAGVPLWTNRYNGTRNYRDKANAVAVDGSNNVIVTGIMCASESYYDYATIKYSSAGVPLWTNSYNGPANDWDESGAVAVDGSDNVVVTGMSIGSEGDWDYATIKYSAAGIPLWTNRYNGPGKGDDYAWAVALDHSGNVIVTGYSTGSGSGYDFATIKYICVPEPVMTALPLTNGTFQMRVDDMLQPGTVVIEASTNLAGWAPVFTNTTPTNVLFYTDPDAGNSPTRFYRAFQFP